MTYTELASTTGEAQTIVDTALRTAPPAQLEPGHIYAFHTPTGIHQVDLTGPKHTGQPPRKTGTTTVRDVASFHTYWDKHNSEHSEVYADADLLAVIAVLDAHEPDAPRWESHCLRLALRVTEAWGQWREADGRLLPQELFAEFLEDHLPELLEPDAATMLEIAQSMQAATHVDFQSGTRLSSGERQFKYVESTTAKAGQRGDITIPETFTVGLKPFEGAPGYKLTARLRYRINNGDLRIGYKLERPDDIRRQAFADVLAELAEPLHVTVMNGHPAS